MSHIPSSIIASIALTLLLQLTGCGGAASRESTQSKDKQAVQISLNSVGGGSIQHLETGIECKSQCTSEAHIGKAFKLLAIPDEDTEFMGWQGPPNCGLDAQCLIDPKPGITATAIFAKVTRYKLTVTKSGSGTVTSAPTGISCGSDCTQNYAQSKVIVLTATPAAGFNFASWSGTGVACPGTGTCSIKMDSAKTVQANFSAITGNVQLDIAVSGNGQVVSTPSGINCPSLCSGNFPNASIVTLTASATAGYQFAAWTGAASNCGNTPTCHLNLAGNMQAGANFVAISSGNKTRVSISGMGHVGASDQSLSCGHAPANLTNAQSANCVKAYSAGTMTFTATPFNEQFKFDHWSGACSGSSPQCTLNVTTGQQFSAVFVPVTASTDICTAMGLKSDRVVYKLEQHFPSLAIGQSFVDPKFGTTIRRVTDVMNDGRGTHKVIKTMYSTISAWNADESYLILYRTSGGDATHELYDGKTYQFIRKLDDIDPVDLEQIYWDTSDPDILYYANRTYNNLYRYRISSRSKEVLHNFDAQCTSGTELHGGSDPLFNSWDSKKFGFACAPNGKLFTYDVPSNSLGSIIASTLDYGAPQIAPSGSLVFFNENSGSSSGRPATVRDTNLNVIRTLDIASADEHGALSMLSNGNDTWNTVAFDSGPAGSGTGSLVQFNMKTGAVRVLVGESTGYPYPPSGTHVGATAFHRTGLVAVSIKDDLKGDSLLDTELLYVDTDAATNPKAAVCRVGHHRTTSDDYWAEPHPVMSPSGTRILFSSSWGDSRAGSEVVNVYVVELPGYRK